jgi:hypothetical protein
MIETIVSNGSPGAAAAALDVAVKLGLDYTGWAAAGEPADHRFRLQRLTDRRGRSPIDRAVDAADGSLFFTASGQTGLRRETVRRSTERLGRPLMIMDLGQQNGFSASRRIAAWIGTHRIRKLHVDGDENPANTAFMFKAVCDILEATFFLSMMDTGPGSPLASVVEKARMAHPVSPPKSLDAAIDHLEQGLSLKDKATIANMDADELVSLHFSLGDYINRHFELFTVNTDLLADCRNRSGQPHLLPADAAAAIIRALWDRLRQTCRIRIVK